MERRLGDKRIRGEESKKERVIEEEESRKGMCLEMNPYRNVSILWDGWGVVDVLRNYMYSYMDPRHRTIFLAAKICVPSNW